MIKKSYVYDIEIYPNLFMLTAEHVYSQESKTFIIYYDHFGSLVINDYLQLVEFVEKEVKTLFGYNNFDFDDLLLKHLLITFNIFRSASAKDIVISLKTLANKIIALQIKKGQKEGIDYINNLKSKKLFKSFDLLMLFNTINRVGLKQIAINLRMPIISDLPFNESDYILPDQIENVKRYNWKVDVASTKKLLENREPIIQERLAFSNQYNVNVTNLNDTNIAKLLIRKYYSEVTGIKFEEYKNKRTFYKYLDLSECIFKKIHFETKMFADALDAYKSTRINPNKLDEEEKKNKKKQFEYTIHTKYITHTLGLGGIHSNNESEILIEGNDYDLIDADVTSWYPKIMVEGNLYPKHLGPEFVSVYRDKIFYPRVEAKAAGNNILAEFLKIAANSTFGLTKSMHSFLYDPKVAMQITINGQLYIMMLIEKLELHSECVVVYSNTDGITVKVPHNQRALFYSICRQWEEYVGCQLEFMKFKKMVIKDVNNYLMHTYSDKKPIKAKGDFLVEKPITSGYVFPIVSKALHEYYVNGINPEYTIKSTKDIYEFIKAERTSLKKFDIRFRKLTDPYKTYTLSKSNRWIVTKGNPDEGKLKKYSFKKQQEVHMQKGRYVTIVNDLSDLKDIEEYKLDYEFYLTEIYNIIRNIVPRHEIRNQIKQLNIFA